MNEFAFMAELPEVEPPCAEGVESVLPQVLKDIEAILGFQQSMRLSEAFGGRVVYVPEKIKAKHKLAKLLGMEDAQKLAKVYGGDSIDMPKAHIYHATMRQIEVTRRHKAGEPVEKLAAEFGVTWRGIYKMIERETRRRARARYREIMGRANR